MKKIRVCVSTGYVGAKREEIIEVEDDCSEKELEEIAEETMLSMIEWGWSEVEGGKRK